MSFKSFETSYLDLIWHELSESVAKIVKKLRFPRNNQKFHFFDPKINRIFWRGSRVPRHFKLTQLVHLCVKQNLWKFQVDRTIVASSRRDFVEIGVNRRLKFFWKKSKIWKMKSWFTSSQQFEENYKIKPTNSPL